MSEEAELSRILVVVRWPVGGIRTWCRYVYRDAGFAAYDIELLIPDSEEAASLRDDLADTAIKIKLVASGDSAARFGVAAAKHIIQGRYSLVHSHGFTSGMASAVPCRMKMIPHLVTPHDVVLDDQYRDLRGWLARRLIGMMLWSATCIQPVGKAAASNLARAFPRVFTGSRCVRIVRNGIEPGRFLSAEPEDVRHQYNIPRDAILVGFFGRFMAQKGFRYLIEAVARYRERKAGGRPLVILAVGGGGFQREEEEAVKGLGLAANFRFAGFTPNVAGIMKAVDVVAMPSLWEACPLLPMEVLTAGTPIIVSDWSACTEIAEGTPAKVVPMRDSEALLDAILAMSTPGRRQASRAFAATAAERFDIKATIMGIKDLYADMTGPNIASLQRGKNAGRDYMADTPDE